nr:MAG TPA: hypothetical protein [Bacteriophage sp.]
MTLFREYSKIRFVEKIILEHSFYLGFSLNPKFII